ncbi:hypothetical protein [Vibrio aestuarianus]|uniref:Chitin-binding type-3 domain-containing protein n=1 Tax=Vibrio aestuarianus TaxID=28171 RepID=A0ABD7YJP1_9VIBR|nr:hypothetical protein [Vibrio aestuarianus]MDE1230983.1 hypothetical protein [Vibrio aestuarianus]MDE1335014.1 hypothetical protein [Vibrio aestuarianus]WGK85116.1 hypothetical protein PYE67_12185 [Vibrio aestuarianus]CAH8224295.1 conserved exported hypothetical protein [Vibrio aestuarianus]
MKLSRLTFCIASALFCTSAISAESITLEQYQALLPTKSGNVDYSLKLADQTTVNYHCNIKAQGDKLILDPTTCDQREINWKKNYPNKVSLNLLNSDSNRKILEHKLWAMAFAHASMQSMVQIQYGLKKENGTFDLDKPFATGESFGEYFKRNMGPNYYVSKALQESSLGDDLPSAEMGDGDDDGVLQVEYPGSAWSELQGAAEGGFPAVFAAMDPENTISSNNGPARNILGSAITSAYYNASAVAINTGAFSWQQNETAQNEPGNRIHEFLQGAKDPDALSMLLSFMYNRGPYAAKDQPLKNEATFQHCMNVTQDLENDWTCFTKQNDFGSRYIRQIPDVSKQLSESGKIYNASLTWNDLRGYIQLLKNYGFYSNQEIQTITRAVRNVFENEQVDNKIKYAKHFGKVLEAVLTSVPVRTFGEQGAIDATKFIPVYVDKSVLSDSMNMVVRSADGTILVNGWATPNAHTMLPLDASMVTLSYQGQECSAEFGSVFAETVDNFTPSNEPTIQITVASTESDCNIYETEFSEPEAALEGVWNNFTAYPNAGTVVVDPFNNLEYRSKWWINAGEAAPHDHIGWELVN